MSTGGDVGDRQLTPTQAAFLMRHLSPKDRNYLIGAAGVSGIDFDKPKVTDLRPLLAVLKRRREMQRKD